jgi:Xaa-Pro dipeptidase
MVVPLTVHEASVTTQDRLAALIAAEQQADRLFATIENNRLVRPGRTETEIDQDIYTLAEQSFGVRQHWHKRIVRAGPNTVRIFAENPPIHEIAQNDTVFLDLGPVFDEWEADVGRTYVMGNDPQKTQLCLDLPKVFDALKQYYDSHPEVTGAELYSYAHQCAEASGWLFGGVIAGRIVGEFPHALLPGDKDLYRISPANIEPMRSSDALGQTKFWILEVHLVDRTPSWGGFYERILVPADLTPA